MDIAVDIILYGAAIFYAVQLALWLMAKLYNPAFGLWQTYNPCLRSYSSGEPDVWSAVTVRLDSPEHDTATDTTFRWQSMLLFYDYSENWWTPLDQICTVNRSAARRAHRQLVANAKWLNRNRKAEGHTR